MKAKKKEKNEQSGIMNINIGLAGYGGSDIIPMNEDKDTILEVKRKMEIVEILSLIKLLWLKYPEQRLGQLLENYVYTEGKRGDRTSIELFYQNDLYTLRKLYYKIIRKNKCRLRDE